MDNVRQRKIADLIKREIGALIRMEMRDPRVQDVTITHVRVTPDLGDAYVYIDHRGSANDVDKVLDALNHAAGFLRRAISGRIDLRKTPRFKFFKDDTLDYYNRIEDVFKQINSDEESETNGDTESSDDVDR